MSLTILGTTTPKILINELDTSCVSISTTKNAKSLLFGPAFSCLTTTFTGISC